MVPWHCVSALSGIFYRDNLKKNVEFKAAYLFVVEGPFTYDIRCLRGFSTNLSPTIFPKAMRATKAS